METYRGGNAGWSVSHRLVSYLIRKRVRPFRVGVLTHFTDLSRIRGNLRAYGPSRIRKICFSKIKISLIIKKLIPTTEKLNFYSYFNSFN